ncbi:Hypothetical_protein [Hexamita inflata]|uniref:Hypothetical_protein n=1 Tax=Hexamita inflata TaxID=28002 RepID=A0AA86U5X3_9EUKA|nr:Hypothetical protein HINF_LOCUS28246 [Hexamita inflata]
MLGNIHLSHQQFTKFRIGVINLGHESLTNNMQSDVYKKVLEQLQQYISKIQIQVQNNNQNEKIEIYLEYFEITPLKLKNYLKEQIVIQPQQIRNYRKDGDYIFVQVKPVCSMQLATDQYVTVNVQLDKNRQQVRDTSSFTLYQDSYIDFVKLKDDQPEIAYKQIGDNITFEELVATEFQFPTAMSCDGYLAVQCLEKDQEITEEHIKNWYKNAVYLQQDQKDDLEYLGRQKFQIVLVQKDDEIFHFEAKDFSDLLEQKSMMTSLSLAVRQLTQKIYNQLREDTDEYLNRHFPNDKFILNEDYLIVENTHVPFNDYIYPLNVFKIENNQGQTNLKPHFNGTIKFKGISNYMNRVADDKEKYKHYVDIESYEIYIKIHPQIYRTLNLRQQHQKPFALQFYQKLEYHS